MQDKKEANLQILYLPLPPPPRFDAAAAAAARPVEPLPKRRFAWVSENMRLAPSHWKLLVLTAIVSLTTGGVGGMLIKDGPQPLANEPTLNSVTGENQLEGTGGMIETTPANVTPSPAVQPQRRNTRLRRASHVQVVELADEDSDDEDEEDRKRKKDADDDDRDRNHGDRKLNHDERKRRVADDRDRKDDDDDHRRSDSKREEDDERVERPRRAAMVYGVIRTRRP